MKFLVCDYTCLTCIGASKTCQTCPPDSNRTLVDNQCSCIPGYRDDEGSQTCAGIKMDFNLNQSVMIAYVKQLRVVKVMRHAITSPVNVQQKHAINLQIMILQMNVIRLDVYQPGIVSDPLIVRVQMNNATQEQRPSAFSIN